MPLDRAVVDAGAMMMLTAAAVLVGGLGDSLRPHFPGLAISLMAGEIASLHPVQSQNADRRTPGIDRSHR
jgi:hypothetical protein